MTRIGLLSDTHGLIIPQVFSFFKSCDEIWHAGDIGSLESALDLEQFKPFRAVYGNIDGTAIRLKYEEYQCFQCENLKVIMLHIGGYPGKYTRLGKELIIRGKPGLFISGHSHILKVIPDKKNDLLHINPGAAGKFGLQNKITMVRFDVDGDTIKELEIFESSRD